MSTSNSTGDLLSPIWRSASPPVLEPAAWTVLLGQARVARLLARLATKAAAEGWLTQVPEGPRRYLEGALPAAERQRQSVRWEIDRLRVALAGLPGPVVLLKGAAYVAAGLPPARGRLFGDIDFMVPRAQLGAVEAHLLAGGWAHERLDPYDERYYRDWMHELPPFKHVWRHTWLDVHHTITPPTSRYAVDGAALLAEVLPLPGLPGFATLSPRDMVLHSAAHLLLDGELPHGLRDLLDLDDLLRHFGADPAFWPSLVERALALGLAPLLALALSQLERLFGTRPPPAAGDALARLPAPGASTNRWLAAALRPHHPSCSDAAVQRARRLLYLRAHALRMPAHQVLPHLARKAWMRARARLDRTGEGAAEGGGGGAGGGAADPA
jgi:hypothetical protein